jgi:hypothetical protein
MLYNKIALEQKAGKARLRLSQALLKALNASKCCNSKSPFFALMLHQNKTNEGIT